MVKRTKRDYPYSSVPGALRALHSELGTWRAVAEFLSRYQDGRFYPSLVHRASVGVNIFRVRYALEKAGLIRSSPRYEAVPKCMVCGELHDMKVTCPSTRRVDTRKTRAWHGTGERAETLDRILEELGYRNLQHYVDQAIIDCVSFPGLEASMIWTGSDEFEKQLKEAIDNFDLELLENMDE